MDGTVHVLNMRQQRVTKKLPDGVQHAGGDAPPPGQTEHPDPADPTESWLWHSGAAPGPVFLQEVVPCHVFLLVW